MDQNPDKQGCEEEKRKTWSRTLIHYSKRRRKVSSRIALSMRKRKKKLRLYKSYLGREEREGEREARETTGSNHPPP